MKMAKCGDLTTETTLGDMLSFSFGSQLVKARNIVVDSHTRDVTRSDITMP
jgi:hypothetical protein